MPEQINCGFEDTAANEDRFKSDNYYNGLTKFIRACKTPMTIAVQGDWGCGKSSLMKFVKNKLDDDSNAITFWINTWQFEQFETNNNLSILVLQYIINQFDLGDEDKTKGIIKKTLSLLKGSTVTALDAILGGRIADLSDAALTKILDTVGWAGGMTDDPDQLVKLRDNIEECVTKYLENVNTSATTKKDRIVFFIDDLDRVAPVKAVELL